MTTYAHRFTNLLSLELGESFEVRDAQGLVIASHRGGSSLSGFLPAGDKRKPVSQIDLTRWVDAATTRVRRDMAHYTDDARARARALLDDLQSHQNRAK